MYQSLEVEKEKILNIRWYFILKIYKNGILLMKVSNYQYYFLFILLNNNKLININLNKLKLVIQFHCVTLWN